MSFGFMQFVSLKSVLITEFLRPCSYNLVAYFGVEHAFKHILIKIRGRGATLKNCGDGGG